MPPGRVGRRQPPVVDDAAGRSPRWSREYRNPARVRLEVETWTDDRIAGLHTRGDCYVTLAHGEGWGIGAFDATAYGNPVVATGWGGFLEYLDDESAFLVDHTLAAVEHNAFASYSADQQLGRARSRPRGRVAARGRRPIPSGRAARAEPRSRPGARALRAARVAQQFLDVLS